MKTFFVPSIVIHSFTPSGVEHNYPEPIELHDYRVIHSFTPSGVEHNYPEPIELHDYRVIHSFTPSGVEHTSADYTQGGITS